MAQKVLIVNSATGQQGQYAIQDSDVAMNAAATGNASTGAHGFLPALSGSSTQYLSGTGNWSTPGVGSGSVGSQAQLAYWMGL